MNWNVTLNVGSMKGRSGEVVHIMARKTCKCYVYKRRNEEGVGQDRLVLDTTSTTTGRLARRMEWELHYAKT